MARPGVSVIVPFRGDAAQATRLVESLAVLELGPDDEVIVADNSEEACFPEGSGAGHFPEGAGVRVIRATKVRSSYFARNAAAAAARPAAPSREGRVNDAARVKPCPREDLGRWLLFIDADCVPVPWLLDVYFAEPIADGVGALAGSVSSDPKQRHFLARYASDRGFLDQEVGVHTADDAAATANLAVRREAFDSVGGFEEGIRSGGDVDLCRRLVAAGWRIERRPQAVVTHLHRESLPDLMGAIARYGSGAAWLNERYPGSAPEWPLLPGLIGAARDVAANVTRLRFEEAAFRGVDALGLVAHVVGYRRSNAATRVRT